MVRAIVAYQFDAGNPALVTLRDISSYNSDSRTWNWQLLLNGVEKATHTTAEWELDFSTVAPPLITGKYEVKLTVTETPETDTTTIPFIYDTDTGGLSNFAAIYDQVLAILNAAITFTTDEYHFHRNKWQTTLWHSAGVDEKDIHNETAWPNAYNTLIAYLVTRGLIKAGATRELGKISTGDGSVKRVETGPVNTDWFNPGTVWKDLFAEGGLWETLMEAICGLAQNLNLWILGCPEEPFPIAPMVFDTGYLGYFNSEGYLFIWPQFSIS